MLGSHREKGRIHTPIPAFPQSWRGKGLASEIIEAAIDMSLIGGPYAQETSPASEQVDAKHASAGRRHADTRIGQYGARDTLRWVCLDSTTTIVILLV